MFALLYLLLACSHVEPQAGWLEVEPPPDAYGMKCFVWVYMDKKESVGGPECFLVAPVEQIY